jgi:RNA polymerase primary sigma factor
VVRTAGQGRDGRQLLSPSSNSSTTGQELARDEEQLLIRRYQGAMTARAAMEDPETRASLAREAQDAASRLVTAQLRTIEFLAWKMHRSVSAYVSRDELMSAGFEGLMIALGKFDCDKGTRLTTYASWWIRNRMIEEVRHRRWQMGIGEKIYRKVIRMSRATLDWYQQHGSEPPLDYLSRVLGLRASEIRQLIAWQQRDVLSLDRLQGEFSDVSFGDLVADATVVVDDQRTWLNNEFTHLLRTLSGPERNVVERRYGFGELREHTRDELAEMLGVTRERVRLLEAKALRKLRHPSRSRLIRDYWSFGLEAG